MGRVLLVAHVVWTRVYTTWRHMPTSRETSSEPSGDSRLSLSTCILVHSRTNHGTPVTCDVSFATAVGIAAGAYANKFSAVTSVFRLP